MIHRTVFIFCLCGLVLLDATTNAQPADDALPDDPDALVVLMAGRDLRRDSMNRRFIVTPASRAARQLIEMKDDAMPALVRGLESKDISIRLNVVYVLNRMDTPEALAARIEAASDMDMRVRERAVSRLPAYSDDAARKILIDALNDPEPIVRNAAAYAFRPGPRDEVGNAIRFATARVLIPLLENPETQYSAATVLGQLDMNTACRPLLKLLDAEEKQVRMAAVAALGQLKDKQVAVELAAALQDEEPYVRMYALQALGKIGDLRSTTAIASVLSAEEPFLRREAATALGLIGDLRSAPTVIKLLEDPDEQTRAAAAAALGQIGDIRAVEPLSEVLRNKGRESAAAAVALGQLKDPRAIGPLTKFALTDEVRPEYANKSVDSLAQICHPDSVAGIVKVATGADDSSIRHHAKRTLEQVTGGSFAFGPDSAVAEWWERNREIYLQPVAE